jgi:hypothetical protein
VTETIALLGVSRATVSMVMLPYTNCEKVWDVAIYICKDNHLSNCSIIFIAIVQYTQMYLNN